MKLVACLIGSLTAVAALTLAGCSGATRAEVNPPARGEKAADEVPTVRVVSPTRTTLSRTVSLPASVAAYQRAELFGRATGFVRQVHVDIGDRVDVGSELAEVDVPEMLKLRQRMKAQLTRLEAERKRAEAERTICESQVEAAEASVVSADAQVKAAAAQLNAHAAELKRVGELVENRSVATRLLDEATQQHEASLANQASAAAMQSSARADVAVAKAKLHAADADVETAAAAIQVANSELEELEARIGFATIRAPFTGRIAERGIDVGDLVRSTSGASERPLFVVVEVDRVRIRVAVPERDARWVNPGDEATVRLTGMPGRTLSGTVTRVAAALDESTRSVWAEIDLDNPDGQILPGMFGEATIILEQREAALLLPAGAVRYDEKGAASVCVVGDRNTISIVPVTTGVDDGLQIEILTGLSGGERVVDSRLGRLAAGQQVRVQP